MIPINGKPVIGWILDDLLKKNIQKITIVLRDQDKNLQNFLKRVYGERLDLKLVPVFQDGTIITSLKNGLEHSDLNGSVHIVLGDTLVRDTFQHDYDFVYVKQITDSRRWCIAQMSDEGQIVDYIDKKELPLGNYLALVGFYHFLDGAYLNECVNQCLANKENQISQVLKRYGKKHPVFPKSVKDWFDFGNMDNVIDARRSLLQSRYFNSLKINPILNTITKISDNDQKLKNEIDWYLEIPEEFKVLAPRLISSKEVNGKFEIVQEYYGYPTLAELYVYADLYKDQWRSILKHVLKIHNEFKRYKIKSDPDSLRHMYFNKTQERLKNLVQYDSSWHKLLSMETISYNGKKMKSFYTLEQNIRRKVERLTDLDYFCVIHGDLCFSNILFDLSNYIIRLIDPRGSFSKKGVYGDPRYDIAKLRHSVCGMYDHIIADMFEIKELPNGYTAKIYVGDNLKDFGVEFDRMIIQNGYELKDIKFLEGLLFLSMLPIHRDHHKRQLMMFFTGLSLLNEVF